MRYIANRSSGKQGHAIAAALAKLGAETLLVSGPTREADPAGVAVRHVETAAQMLAACEAALPVDIAVCAAAVADWRPARAGNQKLKKNGATDQSLELTANPDILATLAQSKTARPRLVVGFAAETEQVVKHAEEKLKKKGCDWILANDVSERHRHVRRRCQHHPPRLRERRRGLADARASRTWRSAWRAASPTICEARMPESRGRIARRFRSSACRTAPTCRCRPMRRRSRPAST